MANSVGYKITIMSDTGKTYKIIRGVKSIKDARAKALRYLRANRLFAEADNCAYIREDRPWSPLDSYSVAPGGDVYLYKDGSTVFYQDGVCWSITPDGAIKNKETL